MQQFVICGCPRTGTTGLVTLINSSKNVFCFNESAIFIVDKIKELLSIEEFYKYLNYRGYEIDEVSLLLHSDEFLDYFGNKYNLQTVGDKTPDYVLDENFDLIHFYNTNLKYIFTTRNIDDTVSSYMIHFNVSQEEAIKKYYDYSRATLRCMSILNKDDFICLNYEESCLDNQKLILKIENFLGVSLGLENYDEYKKQSRILLTNDENGV